MSVAYLQEPLNVPLTADELRLMHDSMRWMLKSIIGGKKTYEKYDAGYRRQRAIKDISSIIVKVQEILDDKKYPHIEDWEDKILDKNYWLRYTEKQIKLLRHGKENE